jgi:hypothetical protein
MQSWGITQLEQKRAKNNDGVANMTQPFKMTLFQLGLVDSLGYDRCKKVSHVLCDFEALVILRFRHLGHYVLKPGNFADISVSKVLHLVQSAGLLNA